jgi:CHAT domain-containing protein/tetratricopeptide (TPR) repeat protein
VGDADQHLSFEQIEWLASTEQEPVGRGVRAELLDEARRHLVACTDCQKLVSMHEDLFRGLRDLEAPRQSQPGPNCPEPTAILELTSAGSPDGRSQRVLEHVAQCDFCGAALRQATMLFSEETTPEERKALAGLDSVNAAWQKSLAQKLVDASGSAARVTSNRQPFWEFAQGWQRWALACAVVLLLAGGVTWVGMNRRSAPESLLARAYTEQRTLELRIDGARYAPLRVERGPGLSRLSRPPELLEAEAVIARNLQIAPDDVRWLHAKGLADLMDNNADSALSALSQAHRLSPNEDSVSIDLASAYFETGEATNSPEDYNRAIDLLRAVTVKDPSNMLAWFNLGIACERMHYYAEALKVWDSYLRIDSDSEWAGEARNRREEIRRKMSDYEKRQEPGDAPAEIGVLRLSQSEMRTVTLRRPIEFYLDLALSSWVPQAIDEHSSTILASEAMNATQTLASIALIQQRDSWLDDLLRDLNRTNALRPAMARLNRAIALNQSGDYSGAKLAATTANGSFKRGSSAAGSMRARFEEVYALHFLQQGESCYSAAEKLSSDLKGRSYVWLDVQTHLEAAICANMTDRMREAKQNADIGFQLAKNANYGALYLRAAMELAVLEWTNGDLDAATRSANTGLDRFWSGAFSRMRGYSLYSVLDSIAEDSELWFADVTVDREATRLLEGDPDHGLLGFEYQRLANAAVHSGEFAVAQEYFQKSEEQFAFAPPGETLEIYRSASEIGLARMDYLKGEYSSASLRLRTIQPNVDKASNRFLALDFYLALGDVYAATREYDGALNSLWRAIDIAEIGLTSIKSERDRSVWMRKYSRAYRAIIRLKLTTDPVVAFELWEWYKAAPLRLYRDVSLHSTVAKAGWLRRTILPPDRNHADVVAGFPMGNDALLSYVFLSDEVGVWIHDATGTKYLPLSSSPGQIEELARRFSGHCADVHSDQGQLNSDSRKLYGLLIKPVVPFLHSKRLLIEADGVLDAIAFESLVNDGDGSLLGDEYDLSSSPGLAYLSFSRSVATMQDLQYALVAASPSYVDGENQPSTLSSANDEAEDVSRLFRHSRLLLGPSLSTPTLLKQMQYADVFHFAGHAIPTREGAGLVLGRTGIEGKPEILDEARLEGSLLKRTRLIFLSACATAGTRGKALSETSSLARAFLSLGVPQVIASRWPIDSDATRHLVDVFYKQLLSGNSATEALRRAKQEVRKENGRSHPYYWAAFSIFGKI